MKFTLAALRIVAAVVGYRLRKLEMANLVAALSIAIALRLPWPEVAYRTAFAFFLNALVYLNNDYIDVDDVIGLLKAKARSILGRPLS